MEFHNPTCSIKQALISKVYYILRPFIPRSSQILIRRIAAKNTLKNPDISWPIDHLALRQPLAWHGWPEGKKFAFVITHDVDTQKGHNQCRQLVDLEENMGFRSSFNFVAKRYELSSSLFAELNQKKFEIGVHGIYHDGKKFDSLEIFKKRAKEINYYLKKWDSVGFRAPSMHCNLNWIGELDIQYDASTFDTDPFEPKAQGVRTIFPFYVPSRNGRKGFVELPYTLAQDFTLFILLKEKSIRLWKEKIDWIVKNGGMILVNIHPDYLNFEGTKLTREEYPVDYYIELLNYIMNRYEGQYWHALPKDVASYVQPLYRQLPIPGIFDEVTDSSKLMELE